jgi:hypothetical protein
MFVNASSTHPTFYSMNEAVDELQVKLEEARSIPDWALWLMSIGVLTLFAINYTLFAACVICHCGGRPYSLCCMCNHKNVGYQKLATMNVKDAEAGKQTYVIEDPEPSTEETKFERRACPSPKQPTSIRVPSLS